MFIPAMHGGAISGLDGWMGLVLVVSGWDPVFFVILQFIYQNKLPQRKVNPLWTVQFEE